MALLRSSRRDVQHVKSSFRLGALCLSSLRGLGEQAEPKLSVRLSLSPHVRTAVVVSQTSRYSYLVYTQLIAHSG